MTTFQFENSLHAARVLGYDYNPDPDSGYPEDEPEKRTTIDLCGWHGVEPQWASFIFHFSV
jgi:hypothetical protein